VINSTTDILLVEDDEGYALLMRDAFEKERLDVNLHHVTDGRQCLEFLRREGSFRGERAPDLVLMDLDMPGMDGREALAAIVADDALKHFPVVILTSREERDEILRMYRLRCNSYIQKPHDFREFVRRFAGYWLSMVVLPGDARTISPLDAPSAASER
jgi:CheY-like chemotaxis protein